MMLLIPSRYSYNSYIQIITNSFKVKYSLLKETPFKTKNKSLYSQGIPQIGFCEIFYQDSASWLTEDKSNFFEMLEFF